MSFEFNILYRFWFVTILLPLSILCSLFVLYHLLFDRNLRQALNNHVIIILLLINLIVELTDIPFILNYFRCNTTWPLTVHFSRFWSFLDYGTWSTQMILFAWATIERHILIFHDQWLSTKIKRIFLHYFPIIFILTYCFIYYLTVIVFLSCDYMNDQSPINGVPIPCAYNNVLFIYWDLLCHQLIPTMIIVIFSIALLVRVLYQKARLYRTIQWQKQRKMTIQLLSIALLYQLLNFPWAFIEFSQMIKLPMDVDGKAFTVIFFLPYYLIYFLPFVCCGTLPKLGKKLKKLLFWQRPSPAVHAVIIYLKPIETNQAFQPNT